MTSQETTPAVRKRRRRPHAGRGRQVYTWLDEGAWVRADARAERAGLALGAWAGLLAQDVAVGRPGLSEGQLEALSAAAVRVARVGDAVNSLAVAEHVGREAGEPELAAVLGRLEQRAAEARAAVAAASAVFEGAGSGPRPVAEPAGGRGRRGTADSGAGPRARRLLARMTSAEFDLVAGAAAREGLAPGAWLGALLEDPGSVRPVMGEAWGAVFLLRRALRRVATNLAQIESARAARGAPSPELLVRARVQVDAAIRACLDLSAAISDAAGRGAGA